MSEQGQQLPSTSLSPPDGTLSVRWRLIALLGGMLLITLLVIGTSVFLFISANEQRAWKGRQEEAAHYAGERIAAFMRLVQDSLSVVGLGQSDILGRDSQVLSEVLERIPALLEVVRLDERGRLVASASRELPVLENLFTIPQSTWFLEAKAGRPYLGGLEISTAKEPYMILAVPAADGGVVAGRLSMNMLWDMVADIEFGQAGQAYVINQDGQIIAHTDPSVALSRSSLEGRPEMDALSEEPGNEWSGSYENFEGKQVVGVTAPVAGTDWVVLTELPQAEAVATTRAALLLVGGGLLVFGIVMAWVASRFLRRLIVLPLEELSVGAEFIGRGDLGHRIEIDRQDEVGRLAGAFNRMASELQDLYQQLTDRSQDLVRRARYLEATNMIARDAATELDLQRLLTRVASLISHQFGFYHTGIFLLDPTAQWAVLQAASSDGGYRMLARGHRLKVGEVGIVGYVTKHAEPRIALDVGEDAVYFDNPDLPDTRSEMALPLRARGEIIGALDVQSREPGAFSQEDVAVLQTLADQVAVAISNARLFQQVQESLEAERRSYGELTREAWRELLRTQSDLGYVRDVQGLTPIDGRWQPEAERALRTGETVLGTDGATNLVVPIQVHGRVIGVVDAHKPASSEGWTAEQVALLKTLSEQLGMALDSARLYQDTQRRAAEDRLVSEITARIRETLDVDTVLRTAVQEMGKTLGIPQVEIRLGKGTTQSRNGQPLAEDAQGRRLSKENNDGSLD
jgi:GAF domain-containing protein/HAMP domain-containing protein